MPLMPAPPPMSYTFTLNRPMSRWEQENPMVGETLSVGSMMKRGGGGRTSEKDGGGEDVMTIILLSIFFSSGGKTT